MAIKTSSVDRIHVSLLHPNKFIELFARLFECEHNPPLLVPEVRAMGSLRTLHLDVFESNSSDSRVGKRIAEMGEGVAGLSFRVENIEEAEEYGKRCGLPVGYPDSMKQVQFDPADTLGFMSSTCRGMKRPLPKSSASSKPESCRAKRLAGTR